MTERVLPALSVLVVEDFEDGARSTAELLALYGHKVRIAGDGPTALRAADEEMPDVVLLDIGLPGLNGWQVAHQLRARAAGKQPLIVAVTGYGTDGDRWRSADAGIDQHLVKPVEPARLAEVLAWVRATLADRPAERTRRT